MEWIGSSNLSSLLWHTTGWPLSPYLFILCLEHLSILLNEATQRKWIQPMTFRDQLRISHLFFVLFVVGLVKLLVHTNPKFSFPQILIGDPRRSYKVFLKFLLLLVGSCFVQYPSPMVMKGSRPPKDGVWWLVGLGLTHCNLVGSFTSQSVHKTWTHNTHTHILVESITKE